MSEPLIINEEALLDIISRLATHQAALDEMAPGAFVSGGVLTESNGATARAMENLIASLPHCVEAMRQVYASHINYLYTVIAQFDEADMKSAMEAQQLFNIVPEWDQEEGPR